MDIRAVSTSEDSAPALSIQAFDAVRRSRMRRVLGSVAAVLSCLALAYLLKGNLLSDSLVVVQSTLDQLRRLGVTLAIDDFGTGYSNLGYLKQFEIQTLKIDQSFVRKVCTSPPDQAIVRAIVNMATQLELTTVAEGIETEEVAQTLKNLGCEIGQGYLWSQALPAAVFEKKYLQGQVAA